MTYHKRTNFIKQLYCNNQLHHIERKSIPSSKGSYWRKQFQENENIFDNNAVSKLINNFNSTINLLLQTTPKNKKKFWKNNILLLNDVLNECHTDNDRLQILIQLKIPVKAYAKWTKTPFTCEQSLFGLCI
jgi:stalled ribosome alternative rescue factor ArfA